MKTLYKKLAKSFFSLILFFSFSQSIYAQTGQCLNFDGVDDYVQAPSFTFGTNWTAEAWVNPSNVGGVTWKTILSQSFWNGSTGFVVAITSNSVFVEGPQGFHIETPITANVWTHIAVTFNNGIFALYKNGLLAGTQVGSFTNSTAPFFIGRRNANNVNNNSSMSDPYSGNIDEIRIWNVTRSQCQIQQFINCEIPSTSSGLVANYHFNEGIANGINFIPIILNNNNLTDHTSNGYNGTLMGFGLSLGGPNSNWTLPGSPAQGNSTPASASTASITVTGNGNTIPDGSTTTNTLNYTDFGTNPTRTFVIQSTGSQTLNAGFPVITGANASQFSVTVLPTSILAASTGSTSFVVTFTPTSVGTKTATLHIYNSECTKTIYDFVISANASSNGLYLDGINDYVNFGNVASTIFSGTSPYTIEAWVKRKSGSGGIIAGMFNGGVSASWYLGVQADGALVSYRNVTPWSGTSAPNLVPEDVWTHVAVTYNGSALVLWVNGVSAGLTLIGGQPSTSAPLLLGAALTGGTPSNFFGGEIDEFKIWNVARSSLEIANGMVAELVGNETNLVAYYHFNKGDPEGTNTIYNTVSSLPVGITGTLTNFALAGCTSNWVCGAPSVGGCPNQPEMTVTGNSVGIVSGTSTVTTTNFTDFGTLATGSALTRTFVIKNNGALPLTISASNLSGSGASNYSITSLPAASIAGGATTQIVVSFSPSTLGIKSATLSITNTDCDENPYNIALEGTGALPAAALSFDGINDVINTTDPVIGLSDFTIEGWIKPNALTGGFLVSSRFTEGFQTGNWYTIGYGSGFIGMEMAECGNGSGNYVGSFSSTHSITPGTWGHFAVVRSGGFYSIYINGNLSSTFTETASHNLDNVGVNPTHILNIGGWLQNTCCWFNGSMDELRIWKVARTQCEIQSFMNCEIPATATNLFSNYHFNQGADGLANPTINRLTDVSASAYSGTLSAGFALTGTISNWVAPGGVTSGNTASVAALIEIDVLGNGASIPDGSAVASTANFTDFNGVSSRTFVIQNTVAGGTLVIATPTITGTNANQFSISALPANSINGIGSTSFVVSFIPNSVGVKNATVNISSNDCNESLYDFVITATAIPASALNFDGTNDQVLINNTSALDNLITGPFSFEAWVNPSLSKNNTIISKGHGGYVVNGGEYIFQLNPSNQLAFFHSDVNGWKYSSGAVPLNAWSHVAVTFDGNYLKFYINGLLDATKTCTASLFTAGNNSVYIGRQGYNCNCNFFQGGLDEIRIWTGARSECEIQQYMNCEIPATATGLLANYHFNQGIPAGSNSTVTTLSDATGVNDGTLSNFNLTTGNNASNWVNPGGVISGSITPAVLNTTLVVSGNGNNIAPGSSTSSTLNFTDFGTSTTRTFVLTNTGSGNLHIGYGLFTGANAANFSITTIPGTLIAGGLNTSLVVTFSPTSLATNSAVLNIFSSDCTNPTYSFVITASTSPASGLSFDGVNDYVQLADPNFGTSDFTLETWTKINSFSTNTYLMSTRTFEGGACCNYWDFGVSLTTGLAYFETATSGPVPLTYVSSANASITTGVWTHLAVVRSGLNLNLYVNGVLKASSTTTAIANLVTGNNSLRLSGSGAGLAMLNGSMDETRIWNVARTQCEIQTFMNCEIPTTSPGLIANYHFNQGIPSGSNTAITTLIDAAGSNTGLLTNFALTGTTSNWIDPGGVVSGFTTSSAPTASMSITGNGNTITAGSTVPTLSNFTDFGTSGSRPFVLQNSGAGTLYINTPVTVSGANASEFSVTVQPSSSLTTGTSSFVVAFTPTTLGTKTAVVNVNSSDCTSPTYSFVISGTPLPASALNFNGTNDKIVIPSGINLNNQSFTIEFWSKRTSTLSGYVVGQGSTVSTNLSLHVGFRPGNVFTFAFYSNDINYTTTATSDGNYHHWACVYDATATGQNRFVYLDGVLVFSDYSNSAFLGTGPLVIGDAGYYGSFPNPLDGTLDELRVWGTARTQCEIQTYMNCEIPTTATGLLANYHFNQGIHSGVNSAFTTLIDAAGANNGTLTSFALTGGTSNWISPGGVASNYTTTAPPTASISLSGNSNPILNNSVITSTLNYTDFGTAATRTFVIQNSSGTLNISAPYLTGINASDFSVTVLPNLQLNGATSTSFVVAFTPTSAGVKSATININDNDCNIPLFKFTIEGTPAPASALNFDGVDDHVVMSDFSLGTGDFTMETWIKPSAFTSPDMYILSNRLNNFGATGNWFNFALSSSGVPKLEFGQGSASSNTVFTGTTTLTAGNWYHIAAVRSGVTIKLFVNGVQELSAYDQAGRSITGNFSNAYIGGWPENGLGRWFNGTIDELRVWNIARSQCEIQDQMNCEITSTLTGLLANYHFNEGIAGVSNTTVTSLPDATGNFNGSLTSFGLNGSASNWVSPGSVTSGSVCPAFQYSEIDVQGNSVSIVNSSTLANPADFTLFNNAFIGTTFTRTFVILNTGLANLTISGYSLSGVNASDFSITSSPAANIAPSGSTSIVITFSPATIGIKNATLNIINNDCDESPYSFAIQGKGIQQASALDFDGVNDYVDLGNTSNLKPTGALTAEAWVNSNWPSIDQTIFGNTENAGYGIFTRNTGVLEGLVRRNSTWASVTTSLSTLSSGWHHIALTYDGRITKLYVDGILKSTNDALSTYTIDYYPGNNTLIGGEASTGSTPIAGWYFTGKVDELRVWDFARSQCEIQTYMNTEFAGTTAGLLANYHFNEGLVTENNAGYPTLPDFAGSSNTGTLQGFALTSTVSNWVNPGAVPSGVSAPGVITASITVNGNSNSIVNNSTATSTLNFTDFGSSPSRTFVIQNSGTGTLNVATPYLTGTNASEFSVTTLPSPSLAASATTSFVVAFTPTSGGLKTATININSNDCNLPLFRFAIDGTPTPGAALSLDGINDYVEIPNSAANNFTNTNAFTVEFWAKTNLDIGGGTMVNKGSGNGQEQFSFDFAATDFRYYILDAAGFFTQIIIPRTSVITVADGWTHIAGVYDGASRRIRLYRNGVEIASLPTTTTALMSNNNPLCIGAQAQPSLNAHFSGQIDELRLWNTVRSQCEIQTYMNCEIPTSATGLVGNYHFNQGADALNNSTVTTLIDVSGSASTGTLVNFSLLTGTTSNWVAPGSVVSGYSTTTAPTASIAVTGNSNPILNNSTATSTLNFTDFGGANSRTFVIQSSGGGTMYINSPVILSGVNAGDFTVTSQPSSSITTGTTNFAIDFIPSALGTRSAIVNINSSDCTSPDYSFVITASASTGAALNLDGGNDFLGTPVFNTQTTDITVQARVFWNGTTTNDKMIVYNGNSNTNGYGLFIAANSNSVMMIYGGQTTQFANFNLTPNQWTALSMVIESNKLSFYANGVLTTTLNPGTNPSTPNGTFKVGVGFNQGLENFNGSIDEVLLWNRALTQCEIQAYLTCEVATSASSLVANYHFNQGIAGGANPTVTTLTDASGNNNHLTLTNFSLNGLTSNWISQGAVTSGSSCAAYVEPDINVLSNAINIPDGNTVTATADNTDFGNITTSSVTVKNYTIQNTGSGPLTVSSITMSGADASMFTVGALTPASPISASSSAVFSVTFAPTSAGTKTAQVNISNNDCDESPYDFVLSGSADPGASISFDGTDDYINCGNILTASYTKEAWVKFSTSTNGNNFLSAGNVTTGSALWAPGIYNYSLSAGHDGAWNQVQDNVAMVPGNWYHIAVTYDASSLTMNLYKNGLLVSTNNTVQPFTGNSPLHIGAFSGTYVATGSIDEVRIWNRPLCAAEIQNNMNCEIPTTAPGLIANYHFNQGVGFGSNTTNTLVTDASGSANTGTLVNFASTGTISNWVPTSTVTSGSSCTPYFAPEIDVTGNGISINDGASTATISNHTDFGGVCANAQVVRTYTIQNTGNANLAVSSITVGGTDASLFNVGTLSPASPVTPGNFAVFSVSFTPVSGGVKTATIFIANNDCNESPYDFVITGTCNSLPVVTANTTASVICDGSSTTLNGGGADTYTWTGGIPAVTNGVAFTPTTTLTYSVTGTNTLTGCTSTNTAVQTITVNPSPTITASSANTVICYGTSITITPGGAGTYTLNPGAVSGTSFTDAPSANITYSITGTSTNNCIGTNTAIITVTVNPLPVVTATASSPVICNTATTSLSGGGADTYTWTGGAVNGISFTPSVTTSYTVVGTNTLTGCTSTNTAVQTITVDAIPTVSATAISTVICEGGSATLTASGASSYTWNPGNVITAVFNPTPSVFTTYTVVGTSSAGCTSTNLAVESISVNSLPTVTASISNSVICAGESVTLTGSGANTYTWTGGAVDGVAFVPLATDVYTLSGTNTAGCTNTNLATAAVTVNTLPNLTITSTKSVICIGDQTTLNGSGALTYTWSNGITDGVAFTPSATTAYTLSGTDANTCENTTVFTVTVNNLPVLTVTSSTATSCEAQTVTLTVSGASSYIWNTGDTLSSIIISPTLTSTYTIDAIDANTCTNTVSYTQSVIPCPGTFTAYSTKTDVSCTGKNDGIIAITSSNSYSTSSLSYYWNPATFCPGNDCDSLKNLSSGTYYLKLVLTYTVNGTLVRSDTLTLPPIIISDSNGECVIKVYSGITANNDGVNDVLTIENIEEFPNNTVTVFNRWGQQVYQVKGYNNLDRSWPINGDDQKLNSGTYFYIIDLGNSSKSIKGWIELIKN